MSLWLRILIGMFLGVIAGYLIRTYLDPSYTDYIKPIGGIFLNLINMIVVLLVFSSMTVGITSIHDPQKLGRVGLKSLFLYTTTTAISILIGIMFAKLMNPGKGIGFQTVSTVHVDNLPKLSEILFSVVPNNPIASLAEGNVLQIVVFSIFLGLAISFAGDKGRPLLDFLESLADVMFRLTSMVMELAPFGVFAIMTGVVGSFGIKILEDLFKFLMCNYLACLVHCVVVFGGILLFMAKLNPLHFFNGLSDAITLALSTNSSSATLPVTMHCAQENLGVSKNIASFVLPLGATVNMNGVGIFQGITAVFVAQAYGIDLDWQSLVTVVVTATLSAVGAAGIPGTGLVMTGMVLGSVGLPMEGVTLIMGVDRIREMVSTVVNILGDAVVAVYIAKSEGELDEVQYNHAELVEMEDSDL